MLNYYSIFSLEKWSLVTLGVQLASGRGVIETGLRKVK